MQLFALDNCTFEIHFDPPTQFNEKVEFLRGDPSVGGISVQCFYKLQADTDYQGPINPAAGNWTDLMLEQDPSKKFLLFLTLSPVILIKPQVMHKLLDLS